MKHVHLCIVSMIKEIKTIIINSMRALQYIATLTSGPIAAMLILILMLASTEVFSQGWEKIYGGSAIDEGHAVLQTQDEGFIITGNKNFEDIFVMKTDPNGNIVWQENFGDQNFTDFGYDIVEASDNGYVIAGTTSSGFNTRELYVFKIDVRGNLVWEYTEDQQTADDFSSEAFALDNTDDGGYIITGFLKPETEGQNDVVYLLKLNSDGQYEWENTFDEEVDAKGADVIQTSDGKYVICGNTKSDGSDFLDMLVIKTSSTGVKEWSAKYGGDKDDEGFSIVETNEGDFVMTGYSKTNSNGWDIYLVKIDNQGNPIFNNYFGGDYDDIGYSVQITNDGGYIVGGSTDSSPSNGDVVLLKTNSNGVEQWIKNHGRSFNTSYDIGYGICTTQRGGYAITGNFTKTNFFNTDIYLVTTDENGNIYSNYIEGNVFRDFNNNCIEENGEYGIEDWVIVAEGAQTFYGASDENGDYSILVDTGSYNVYLANPQYWDACISNYNIDFETFYDTLQIDFAIHPNIPCPLMEVDLSTTNSQACSQQVYYVNYCNHGSLPAQDANVQIILDTDQEFVSSSVPLTSQTDSILTFDLGDVPALYCGSFKFTVNLSCDLQNLETACVQAIIFPNESCIDDNPEWDMSSIQVSGACVEDSVKFTIENIGLGATSQDQNWIVIEDDVIFSIGDIDLPPGESENISYEATGSTYRLIAEQSNGHPGFSYPTVAVEGCVAGMSNTPVYGELTQFPNDDNNPYVSISCIETSENLVNSGILAYPKGYTQDTFYIDNNAEISYQINFQNTGDATASRVVIRDTIPNQLDITTLSPGASSHPYEYEIYGNGIVMFVFEDILLPNSSVDEVGSIGFIKFNVSQKPDLPVGTMILNRAASYIEYAAGNRTDYKKHTVNEDLFEMIFTDIKEYPLAGIQEMNIFPNPFSEATTFEIVGDTFDQFEINIYDVMGRHLRSETHNSNQFAFERKDLSYGTYFFKITTDGQLVSSGKMIIQ